MDRAQRLQAIVATVAELGEIRVAALSETFGVSEPTIRRDLAYLQRQQLVTRVHGSARPHAAFHDLPLGLKTTQDLVDKRRIARRALEFVGDARIIGLTGGTTMTEFARAYRETGGATVVTNALNIAAELVRNPRIQVVMAGGEVRASSQEAVGHQVESQLAAYHLDVALLGVDGIDADAGVTAYDPAGARVNAILRAQARTSIVLADAAKLGRVALAGVCDIADIDVLITDRRATDAALRAIRRRGCRVVVV